MMWLEAIWLFLPAGIANMAPVLVNKVPLINRWNAPMDFGVKWRGVRIFGPHKTWRGLVSGVVFASVFAAAQYAVTDSLVASFSGAVLLGGLLGFGALVGDAAASFFKRQRNIPSGKAWIPFDQTDYIVGGLVFSYPLLTDIVSPAFVLVVLITYTGLHFLVSYIGYRLGLKQRPV